MTITTSGAIISASHTFLRDKGALQLSTTYAGIPGAPISCDVTLGTTLADVTHQITTKSSCCCRSKEGEHGGTNGCLMSLHGRIEVIQGITSNTSRIVGITVVRDKVEGNEMTGAPLYPRWRPNAAAVTLRLTAHTVELVFVIASNTNKVESILGGSSSSLPQTHDYILAAIVLYNNRSKEIEAVKGAVSVDNVITCPVQSSNGATSSVLCPTLSISAVITALGPYHSTHFCTIENSQKPVYWRKIVYETNTNNQSADYTHVPCALSFIAKVPDEYYRNSITTDRYDNTLHLPFLAVVMMRKETAISVVNTPSLSEITNNYIVNYVDDNSAYIGEELLVNCGADNSSSNSSSVRHGNISGVLLFPGFGAVLTPRCVCGRPVLIVLGATSVQSLIASLGVPLCITAGDDNITPNNELESTTVTQMAVLSYPSSGIDVSVANGIVTAVTLVTGVADGKDHRRLRRFLQQWRRTPTFCLYASPQYTLFDSPSVIAISNNTPFITAVRSLLGQRRAKAALSHTMPTTHRTPFGVSITGCTISGVITEVTLTKRSGGIGPAVAHALLDSQHATGENDNVWNTLRKLLRTRCTASASAVIRNDSTVSTTNIQNYENDVPSSTFSTRFYDQFKKEF